MTGAFRLPVSHSNLLYLQALGLEAPPGFEPGMEVLQTSALPLGDGADSSSLMRERKGPGRVYAQRRQRVD